MNAGASPDRYLQKGDDLNPLQAAASRGFKEYLRLLLPKAGRSTTLRGLERAARRCGSDTSMLELFKQYVPDAVLHHAISRGFNDLASDMLDSGVIRMNIDRSDDVDFYRWRRDYSPAGTLYVACETGNISAVERMIQEGVDVNIGDAAYGPSLSVAAYEGHLDIVKLLIKSGCSLSDGDGIFGGPVQAAVLGNHLDVLKLLVSSGASVNTTVGVAHRLFSCLPLSGSPLKAAITTGNWRLTIWLLNHGEDVNYGGGLGPVWEPRGIESPLMIAASRGDLDFVHRLLKAGAEINQHYEGLPMSPITALEAACENGKFAVAERLLTAGASIERAEGRGGSGLPLFFAVRAGSLETVLLLLKKGASPNSLRHREKGQTTILSQACKGVNAKIVSALVEAGADVHKTSHCAGKDELPIQTAVRRSTAEVVRALIKHGASLNGFEELHTAIRKGMADILHILLSEGQADPSLRLSGDGRPIHHAAKWDRPECLRVLVEAGAHINSRDGSGKTPLHWAIRERSVDALRWLLKNRANERLAEYEENLTPLGFAQRQLEQAKPQHKAGAERILRLLS